MKTPEEALKFLDSLINELAIQSLYGFADELSEAVKILKPLATQDRERLALTQHWES